jgi:hypothetical protein
MEEAANKTTNEKRYDMHIVNGWHSFPAALLLSHAD